MFVKQLIGRLAGTVVDMPYAAATSNIAAGTCVLATDEEVAAAGLTSAPIADPAPAEALPIGYRIEPAEVGGFDVYDPGGVRLNQMPHPNVPAARSAAADHAAGTVTVVAQVAIDALDEDEGGEIVLPDGYRLEPASFGEGFDVFDPGSVLLNEEPIADEAEARLLAAQHHEGALGQEDLDDGGGDSTPLVPENWKDLHHSQRRALAARIAGRPFATTAQADEVIEEYLTRQAA